MLYIASIYALEIDSIFLQWPGLPYRISLSLPLNVQTAVNGTCCFDCCKIKTIIILTRVNVHCIYIVGDYICN